MTAPTFKRLGVVHGRAPAPIGFSALTVLYADVAEFVGARAGALQVICFDRAPDAPRPRIARVVLEGRVGDEGGAPTAVYGRRNA